MSPQVSPASASTTVIIEPSTRLGCGRVSGFVCVRMWVTACTMFFVMLFAVLAGCGTTPLSNPTNPTHDPLPATKPPEDAALLTLEVEPPNPTVWINGQLQGELSRWSDRTLPLPEGRHRLELRHDGYYPHRADLTLQPNQPMTLRVLMVERLD